MTDSAPHTTGDITTTSDGSAGETPWGGCGTLSLIEERFDSLPLDAEVWNESVYGPASAAIVNGTARVALELTKTGHHHAYWGGMSKQSVPTSGFIGLEVVEPPDPQHTAEVYVALFESYDLLFLSVAESEIRLTLWDAQHDGISLHSSPYDHVESRWVRMAFDRDLSLIVLETSADGDAWSHLDTLNVSMNDWTETWMEFGAGAWYGPVVDDDLARLDNVFLCAAE